MEKDNSNKGEEYVVCLPDGVNVRGYESIPKIGRTIAYSPKDAVANFVFRNNKKIDSLSAVVLSILENDFGGMDKYAFLMPEVIAVNKPLTFLEKKQFQEYFLAYELAKRKGLEIPTSLELDKAKDISDINSSSRKY